MAKIEFSDKQSEFISGALDFELNEDGIWRNRLTVLLFGGAIRGGKTWGGLGAILLLCRLFPGSRWAVVRRSIEDLKRNTMTASAFYALIPQERLIQRPTSHNSWTAIISNGPGKEPSEIVFFSENFNSDKELNRWKGLEVNGFLLEECNELNELSYFKAVERLGSWKINRTWKLSETMHEVYPAIILMTCNPAHNWVKKRIYKPWRARTLSPSIDFIPSTSFDNPHVSEKWRDDKAEILPEATYERFVMGEWDVTENDRPFLHQFDYDRHVFKGDQELLLKRGPVYLSCDQNVEPPMVTAWQYGKGWVHCIAQSNLETGSVYEIAEWVKQHPLFVDVRLKITGDAAGHARSVTAKGNESFYKILARLLNLDYYNDVVAPRSNMRHEDSRNLCNSVLKAHPHFLIHHSCEKLIEDCLSARVDKEGNLVKDRRDESKFLDAFDTLRYAIATFFPDWLDSHRKYL
jgi:hypothetical protein